MAAVAFLFMYEWGLGGFFHDGSYVLGTAGACLVVDMLLVLALAGTRGSTFFLAWLEKLELWGKASLGLLRKSVITFDGGLCTVGDFVSRTTLVSTFSTGARPRDMEEGRVAALPVGLVRNVEKDADVGGAEGEVIPWSFSTASS